VFNFTAFEKEQTIKERKGKTMNCKKLHRKVKLCAKRIPLKTWVELKCV
jgi:hypothetical protein